MTEEEKLRKAMIALRAIHRIASNDPEPGSDDEKDIEKIEAIAGLAIWQIDERDDTILPEGRPDWGMNRDC